MIVRTGSTAPALSVHRTMHQAQLGFLPLIAWGVLAAGSAAAGAYAWWTNKDYEDFKGSVQAPTPPPAPAAPQTRAQMTQPGAWTPEIAAEYDSQAWQSWRRTAIPATPDQGISSSNGTLWLAAGAAALALILIKD